MTSITIELPDEVAAFLQAKAFANNTTPQSFAQAIVVNEIQDRQIDESKLAPYEPSPLELLVLEKAEADIAAGNWLENRAVMAKFQATLRRD